MRMLNLDQVNLQDNAFQDGRSVTVSDIKGFHQKGLTTREIRKRYPGILPETIALGHAFLIAADPDGYEALIRLEQQKAKTGYKGLVDECLSARVIIPGIRRPLGHATHTNLVSLRGLGNSGPGDKKMWEWAVEHEKDFILTADLQKKNPDKDLIGVALQWSRDILRQSYDQDREVVAMDNLPVIICCRATQAKKVSHRAVQLLSDHSQEVKSYLEMRTAPYISLSEKGVRVNKTYAELYAEILDGPRPKPAPDNVTVISRRNAYIKAWCKKIFNGRSLGEMNPDHVEAIRNMVKAAAALRTLPGHQSELRAKFREEYRDHKRTCISFTRDDSPHERCAGPV